LIVVLTAIDTVYNGYRGTLKQIGAVGIWSPFPSAPLTPKRGSRRMQKIILSLASVALIALLSLGLSGSIPTHAEALTAKPNIVFILTDDMRKDDLKYMSQTRTLLKEEGMMFQNAFVSNALCCPSRATTMCGQYSHNTGVWNNRSPVTGGWQAYNTNGDRTIT
jgi:hypothetical protein